MNVNRKVDPKFEKVVEAWNKLSNDEREKLLPHLLNGITGWRAFSVYPQAQMNWLERVFKNADVPIR